MKKSSLLKATLYLGAIVLLTTISISFNSLRILTHNNSKIIRIAQDRIKLDEIELQIIREIKNNPNRKTFSQSKIKDIDEVLNRYEQLLKGGKLPTSELVREKWDQLKIQSSPDPNEMISKLEESHQVVNARILEEITKRIAVNDKDISHFKILKIATNVLIIFLVFIAMYLDTIQSNQKEELLRKLLESEKNVNESKILADYSTPENIRKILDNI